MYIELKNKVLVVLISTPLALDIVVLYDQSLPFESFFFYQIAPIKIADVLALIAKQNASIDIYKSLLIYPFRIGAWTRTGVNKLPYTKRSFRQH